jgi:nicotinamidase-related amidase
LTDVDDSVLIVVDVQQSFLDKLDLADVQPLVNRIAWIVRIAAELGVPIIATAEDIADRGTTVAPVAAGFPPGTEHHDKMIFGLTGDPDILGAVEAHERRTAVLVGLETDVCVMQSALGLLDRGFRVVALSDATASPGPCHEAGLTRMRDAGVIVSTVKGTFYEWVRTLDFAEQRLDPEIWTGPRPDGIHL